MIGIEFEELDPDNPVLDHPSPFTLVGDCFRNTAATLKKLLTPRSPIGVSQMSGPVGIMNLYYNIFQNPNWWRLVLWFSVVLNVGLAIFNMLPVHPLDGGIILYELLPYEGRRKYEEYVIPYGSFVLLGLMLVGGLSWLGYVARFWVVMANGVVSLIL